VANKSIYAVLIGLLIIFPGAFIGAEENESPVPEFTLTPSQPAVVPVEEDEAEEEKSNEEEPMSIDAGDRPVENPNAIKSIFPEIDTLTGAFVPANRKVTPCRRCIKIVDHTIKYGRELGGKMNQIVKSLPETYNFSTHAVRRIAERIGVGNEGLISGMLSTKPFEYIHQGVEKLGYYNEATKVFIAQIKDSKVITTVIDNVEKSYIANLIKK
jgi:hypothetical protein